MTTSFIHPALILIFGGLLLPFIKGPFRKPYLFIIPLLTLLNVVYLSWHPGVYGVVNFMGGDWTLTFGRVDRLSMVFGFIMALMAVIGTVYGLHVSDDLQHIAAWFYVAGSLGVIYCGDYLVLFLFWELMAFASTFLIWFNKDKGSLAAGYRYLLVHTFGGVVLLLGFVLRYQATGDLSFVLLSEENTHLYTWLIMAGLMLNAAVPPLHSWLPDAYSKATVTGAVFMCAFTTKTAIYTLARGFAGFDILIVLGVVMAIYGIIYAIIENDIRRLLGWEIVSQVGYMVAGVGIGTALAINGTCAHAFAHILYKGLLFMAAGAVIHATGKSKFTDLGGLYKKMPLTFFFLVIGGISVSAFPFFSGFVTKSMIIAAGFQEHLLIPAFLLTMVSVGTFLVAGLRLPYLIFFGDTRCSDETWAKAEDPPWNMQLAMLAAGFFCLLIGSYTPFLYNMLPYTDVAFHPYGSYHLSETLQLLAFTAIIFIFLKDKIGAKATISLDLDWFYRRGGRLFLWLAKNPIQWLDTCWGSAYKVVGLYPLMTTARFWSWFDWHGIDGVVDGSARCVRAIGRRLSLTLQRGQIQQTIYISITFAAILLVSYVWL
ncbi:MAG: Na(+)/H(+) antiporter subunit D [Desulfobulbaceae bacterium S3730MH12]|nr:MAG: Na(+)/H(+) antiporter subunit D [Desulfobulbaceae bacterium S5133MH15]OEU58612.1 MAG: Na(+)/H(+) antiporter subunit D [Desulfobulbaceae bacterium S3730MH12]OEU84582.1 MAG: Na(+)/H(+) antiporter subunit D [Desulfobulbaceae bacterium C00003063]